MQSFIKKKLNINIDLTVDSSELLMMDKGGKHTCQIDLKNIMAGVDFDTMIVETVVSIQIPSHQQKRFDYAIANAKFSLSDIPT